MKLEQLNKPDQSFKPVSIVFTFETQAELDAWGGLFNSGVFTDAMQDLSGSRCDTAWKTFNSVGADLDSPVATTAFQIFQNLRTQRKVLFKKP